MAYAAFHQFIIIYIVQLKTSVQVVSLLWGAEYVFDIGFEKDGLTA